MTTADYPETMASHSNESLVKILTLKRDHYQPEALEAAEQELEKRGLKLSDFATPSQKPIYSEVNFAGHYNINAGNSQTGGQPDMDSVFEAEKKKQAGKDMLYGGLWFAGGLIATMADVGAIFWGAMVFGGIQFFKGLINSQSN